MFRAAWSRLQRNKTLQGVVSIAGGTALGQGLGIVLAPILTRLYPPEAMGLWGLFISFMSVAAVGGALRYEIAIVAARSDEDAQALAGYALTFSLFTAALGGGVFSLWRRWNVLGYGVFPAWAAAGMALAISVHLWGEIFRYWFVRRKTFSTVGLFVASRGALRALAQIGFAWWQMGGLIGGEILGRLLSLTALFKRFPLRSAFRLALQEGKWRVLLRFRTYPLVFLPSAFLDTLGLMAPVPVFTAAYGLKIGGMLALAQRVVSVPLGLLGTAVADVFFGEIAAVVRERPERAQSLFLRATWRLGSLALVLGGGLMLAAPEGVRLIFGQEWALTGQMLAVMTPWFMAMFVLKPLSRLIFLSRYPWAKLLYDIMALAGATLPLWWPTADPLIALQRVAWIQAILYLGYWSILFVAIRRGLEVK